MTKAEQIAAAHAAAEQIDPEVLALIAKENQLDAMDQAEDSFAAYWAGSASASIGHHYAAGAVRVVRARR